MDIWLLYLISTLSLLILCLHSDITSMKEESFEKYLQFSKTVEDKKKSDWTLRRTLIKSFACNAVVGFQALILIKVNLSASTFQGFVNFLGTPISRNIILRADFTTYFFNLFLCLANKWVSKSAILLQSFLNVFPSASKLFVRPHLDHIIVDQI